MWVLLAACAGKTPTDGGPSDSHSTDSPTDTAPLACEFVGCDGLCVEVGATWVCGDTAAAWEACYDGGFQVCEPQDDGSCGWTMLDPDGWDACVEG